MIIRSLLIWGIGIPLTALAFIIMTLIFLVTRGSDRIHAVATVWCRALLLLAGVKVSVNGAQNMPKGVPLLILSNHQGAFDIPVLQAYLPISFRWVAKRSLFKLPLVGWSMTLAGYIPVDREQGSKAYRSLKKASEQIVSGTSVVLFPEGTRSADGELLPFKRGAFLLAAMCKNAMILPVAVHGTKSIMKKGSLMVNPGRVNVFIGKPFSPQGMKDGDLSVKTRAEITGLLAEAARTGS